MVVQGTISSSDGGGYRVLVGGRVSLPARLPEHIQTLAPGDEVVAFFPSETLADGIILAKMEVGAGT